MHLFIGIFLAAAVAALARWGGLDRDRAFYPTVMMVIASIYVLFAAIANSPLVLVAEALIGAAFIALAFGGFRQSLWLVVVALAAWPTTSLPPCSSACTSASPISPPTGVWCIRGCERDV